MNDKVAELLKEGQSIWQDDLARPMFATSALATMIDGIGVRGVTSNPTIFEKAIASSDAYDKQITELAAQGFEPAAIFEELAIQDIQSACDLFSTLYHHSAGADGFVSMEVTPDLARDSHGTREAVRRLWQKIDRPNLMIKIPGTVEGAPIVEEMLAEGRNINITLLFSLEAYERVAQGYINALETRVNAGQPVSMIASVASFFVSRVDTAVDAQLDEKIAASSDPAIQSKLAGLKGTAAVANAKLAYQAFERNFSGQRWTRLVEAGARPQRPLWASTGTKNPAYSDVLYVETLIGPHTVNTMPGKTIDAFIDHGLVEKTVSEDVLQARAVMRELEKAGIGFDAVTAKLEDDGIAAFDKSYKSLLGEVEKKSAVLLQTA